MKTVAFIRVVWPVATIGLARRIGLVVPMGSTGPRRCPYGAHKAWRARRAHVAHRALAAFRIHRPRMAQGGRWAPTVSRAHEGPMGPFGAGGPMGYPATSKPIEPRGLLDPKCVIGLTCPSRACTAHGAHWSHDAYCGHKAYGARKAHNASIPASGFFDLLRLGRRSGLAGVDDFMLEIRMSKL